MAEKIILGIDEVGRGPWAGPLVVGAVILGAEFKNLAEYTALTDSKKLTAKKREDLNEVILQHAAATGLGWVSVSEIDHYGLGPALKLAARRAVKPILAQIAQNRQTPSAKSTTEPPKRQTASSTKTQASTEPNAEPPAKSVAALQKFDEILVDGTINLLAGTPLENKVALLPKADFLVKEVSAASIIAKVARDRYMANLAGQYPGYGFEKHVGYGTAAHKSALLELGPCPEHRKSFRPIAELIENPAHLAATQAVSASETNPQAAPASQASPATTNPPTARDLARAKRQAAAQNGQKAEQIVARHLETVHHHTILARNFKAKSYEIDIISLDAQNIYFTEVKYRKTASRGTALEQITPKKRQQIQFAAEAFLAKHPEYKLHQPLLAAASVEGPDFHLDGWFTLPE